jgi:hypothetical protein
VDDSGRNVHTGVNSASSHFLYMLIGASSRIFQKVLNESRKFQKMPDSVEDAISRDMDLVGTKVCNLESEMA